jgi:beta-barrel assembly-enhancing protease
MKILKMKWVLGLVSLIAFTSWNCKVGSGVITALMPDISEDAKLGAQVSQEINSNPKEYPILPENGNQEVYAYVRGITNKILNSGAVQNRDAFPWAVKIINDNKTLNAFCTPGGYIYVYTGLIKYLDSEDQLAGVMGHEIAHADKRHSMRQLVKQYGVQALLGVGAAVATSGKSAGAQQTAGQMAQVATSVVGLSFSRDHETEADNTSVKYLCSTDYSAAGFAAFFEKMGNAGSPPQFLSTHPSPTNRVQNIHAQAEKAGCKGTNKNQSQYQRIKNLLK